MNKSKVKISLISFLLAAVAVCLSVALAACGKDGNDKSVYNVGEEGIYYYDKDASTEYLMSLQSGTYMISADGTKGYSGTYSYKEEEKTISFRSSDGESFDASFSDDVMQLSIADTPYTFLKKVDYTVNFMDGSVEVAKQSVTYGKAAVTARAEDKDGYYFLGWYEDESFTTKYEFNTAVTGDVTLYAYYIPVNPDISNFEVKFVSGGDVIYTARTQNGVVYDFPDGTEDGWWVSATGSVDELTYKYEGEVLKESTTLYEMEDQALAASVYADKVTWEASTSSVTVYVDGEPIARNVTTGYYSYDFEGLSAGRHEITVSNGSVSETRVYMSKALSRVSNFEVYGNVLVYNAVENAQYYYISVECANPAHDHTMVYNGNTLTYDFSNCEMGAGGIIFTVYAYGVGYVESVSETYVYALILDEAVVRIDSATDTASWNSVANATGYEVYVDDEYVTTTPNTEYSLKNYGQETISVAVKPIAPGYYSEESEAATYTKITLPAPEITGINEYTVSWSKVDGATDYVVHINGKRIATVGGEYTSVSLVREEMFTKADSYVITVRAMNSDNANQNSQESDPVYATDDEMSPLLVYEDGVVYWQYAMSVGTYYVTVNDGDETAVEGKNSFPVTFTRSGENVIKVYFKSESGRSTVAGLTVTAYAVIFDSRGGDTVDTIYVAKGDKLDLTEPEYTNADAEFAGWYTLPDLVGDYDAFEYLGDGCLVQSGSVFDGSGTLVLYAGWLSIKYVTYLDPGIGIVVDENGKEIESTLVAKNSSTFNVAVPEVSDAAYVFYGWYSQENGNGTRYTDNNGRAVAEYDLAAGSTLYAYWINVLTFTVSSHDGETYLSVSKGSDISLLPDGILTVPDKYTLNGVEYTVGILESTSFSSCSSLVTLNLPDTIVYIPITNSGYSSGSGAFSLSRVLKEVNIYATGDPGTEKEIHYYSHDGVLYELETDGELKLIYYPYAKSNVTYTIPDSISNENEYALDDNLNEVPVERGVGSIATRVLSDNTHLTTIIISGTVNYVDQQAFYKNKYITSVVFEEADSGIDATLTIAANAFQGCTALETVTLPSHLVNFDSSIFTDCTALVYIYVDENAAGNYSSMNGMLCNDTRTEIIYCPLGMAEVELGNMYGLSVIGKDVFNGRTKMTTITIPSFVTEIGESAFEDCTGLEKILFEGDANSNSLTIRTRAFYGCTALTTVALPGNLKTMEQYAFGGCRNLTTVYVESVSDELDFADYSFATSASSHTYYVETIYIGGDAGFFNISGVFGNDLDNIYFQSGVNLDGSTYSNPNYLVIDDVIYSGDGTTLIYFPKGVDTLDTTSNPSLTTIESQLFNGKTNLKKVIIGVSVTDIGEQAFYSCTSLESLIFAEGERSGELKIGKNAFYGCTALTVVSFPANTSSIGDYAFDGCKALTSVIFEAKTGEGAADELNIGSYAFRNTAVTSVVIPSNVTEISEYTFYGCSSLSEVAFPEGLESVGSHAFYGCSSLTKVELNSDLKSLDDYAFYECTSLADVDFGGSLESVGSRAFYGCSKLDGIVILDSVTSIGSYAFYGCKALTSITFNGSLNTINDYTFYGCSSLSSITLPKSLGTIGDYVFSGCSSLTTLTIPSTVTKIGKYASNGTLTNLYNVFLDCTSLTSITVESGNSEFSSLNGMLFDGSGKILYVVPEAVTEVEFGGADIEEIHEYAFYNCKVLTAIEIPEKVTSIALNAFKNCTNLTSIKILPGEGDELVLATGTSGNGVFGSLPALTEMVLSDRIKTLPAYTFDGCSALESIEIPCGVTSIGLNVFEGCTSLETITFATGEGKSLSLTAGTSKTAGVFVNLAALKKITMTNRLTSVPAYCFYGCTSLTEIDIPGSVTALGNYSFYGCSSLVDVTLNEGLTEMGTYVFAETPVYDVATPSTLTSIGNYAFNNCYELTYITLNEGLGSLGTDVFKSDYSLLELVVPDSVKSIGTYLCQNCYRLSCVTIGSGLSSLANYSFSNCYELVEIHNRSTSITITIGETSTRKNGGIGGYAQIVYGPDDTPVTGFETTEDGYRFFFDTDEGGETNYSLFAYVGTAKELVLPEGYKEKEYDIHSYAFYMMSSITSVIISEGVTSIGVYAFRECTSLKSVTISSTVTSIGNYAFHSCAIEKIVIPDSVTYVGNYSFYSCAALKSVTFGANVETIGNYSFQKCGSLTEIVIPGSVTLVDKYAFDSTNLTKITLNEGLLEIGERAFYETQITSIVIPDTVETIGANAFGHCYSLMSVVIGSGVASVTGSAFTDDYKLVEVYNLSSLSVEAGIGVDESGNVGLNALAVYTTLDAPSGLGRTDEGYITYVADGVYYLISYDGTETDVVLPEKINGHDYEICHHAFYGTEITSIEFSAGTNEIGAYAFSGVASLKAVVLPSSLVAIDEYAFNECSGISEITIPSTLKYVGQYGFYNCSNLKKIYVDSLETWFNIEFGSASGNPLYNEGSLYVSGDIVKNIVVPESVTVINPYVFYKCSSLNSLVMHDGVTYIGTYAFYSTGLMSVMIGNGVTYIGSYAFSECRSFTEIVVPDSVEEIGTSAFRYCEALETVTLGKGVTSLGNTAFQCCYALSVVYFNPTCLDDLTNSGNVYGSSGSKSATGGIVFYIGDNVEKIPAYCFYTSSSANSRHYGTAVIFGENSVCTSIGQYAFRYCDKLEYVVLPASLESIAAHAFRDCSALEIVYYGGTEQQWSLIDVSDSYNTAVTDAVFYYFSAVIPPYNAEGTACDGGYWHFDENNLPVEWVYEPTRYYVESSVNFVMYNEDLDRIVAVYIYDSRIKNTVGYLVADYEYSEEEDAYIVELENGDMYLIELNDETLTSTITEYFPEPENIELD